MQRSFMFFCAVVLIGTFPCAKVFAGACFDSDTEIEPIGWNAKGTKLLVKVTSTTACETAFFLSELAIGQSMHTVCYDLLGEPNRKMDCSAVSREYGEMKLKKSRVPKLFRTEALPLHPKQVRASIWVISPNTEENDPPKRFEVQLLHMSHWTPLWKGAVGVGHPETEEEGVGMFPHYVRVFPAPRGHKAALLISNDAAVGGDGQDMKTSIVWVDLPKKFSRKLSRRHRSSASILRTAVPGSELHRPPTSMLRIAVPAWQATKDDSKYSRNVSKSVQAKGLTL